MRLSYDTVKKDPVGNYRDRMHVLQTCSVHPELGRAVRESCAHDILLWTNLFLWTYDPRKTGKGQSPHIPFVTWPYQDALLRALEANIGERDVGIEKARDMGASWGCLVAILHQWQFQNGRAFMVVSRNERLVDSPSDPDTLFWKLDYLLRWQPPFLLPRFQRTKLHLANLDTGSNIDGASTTADVGRGGRRTAFLLDEYGAFEPADSQAVNAATASNTECRIFNSTYKGTTGAFYEQMQRKDIVKISLPWALHPEKAKGMTTDAKGKRTSPWYEAMCRRLVVPGLVAQELDMDPAGSVSGFFAASLVDRLLAGDAREPYCRGRLDDPADGSSPFTESPDGDLLLWTFAPDGHPPLDGERYVIGCDVATGTGATNSVVSVVSLTTGEKVAELASPHLSPDDFAVVVHRIARWFGHAQVAWEMNGPGGPFGKKLTEGLGYRNVYFRRDEQALAAKDPATLTPGWHANPTSKFQLFSAYASALASGAFVNRSAAALKELRDYVYLPTGHVGNAAAEAAGDPSGARQNHGDRPTADALANKLLGERSRAARRPESEQDPTNPPVWSFQWRANLRKAEQRLRKEWGPAPSSPRVRFPLTRTSF